MNRTFIINNFLNVNGDIIFNTAMFLANVTL